MKYIAKVTVMPKDGVADPQGLAVKNALHSMDCHFVENVRIGKMIVVEIGGASRPEVKEQVKQFTDRLLVNPNIEKGIIEIVEDGKK